MGFFSKLFRDRDPQQPGEATEPDADAEAGADADAEPSAPSAHAGAAVSIPAPPPEASDPEPAISVPPVVASPAPIPEPATPPTPPPPAVASRTAVQPEPKVNKRRVTMPSTAAVPRAVAPPAAPAVPAVAARADSGRIPIRPPRTPAAKLGGPAVGGPAEARRPAATRGAVPGKEVSGAVRARGRRDSTADLFAEIDTAIDSAQEAEGVASREGVLAPDTAATADMERLFGEIAAQQAAHLRDFVIELSLAPTGKAWLVACAPAIEALKVAAQKIQNHELVAALGRFEAVLRHAKGSARASLEGEPRQEILASYEELRRILPAAFDVSGQRDRREPIVLSALIAQVPGITSLDVHRIYGAGAMSLSMLVRAQAGELSSVTGIPRERCAAIVERISAYHRQRAEHPGAADGRDRLRRLLDTLLECEARFRDADEAEDRKRKRELRRERLVLAKQIELELTDLGKLDLVTDLQRESTERKIARLERWLREPVAPSPSEHASPPQ